MVTDINLSASLAESIPEYWLCILSTGWLSPRLHIYTFAYLSRFLHNS